MHLMTDSTVSTWSWNGSGVQKGDGRLCYESVVKETPGLTKELYKVGDVVTIDQTGEEGLWIAQITEFFQEGDGSDGMYMYVRWFYSRAQLIGQYEVSDWESTSPRHRIAACEILASDHLEFEPNHVLNIAGHVLLASGRDEYAKLLVSRNNARYRRLCRMIYNPKHSDYIDGLALRFLERGELQKLLRRVTQSEIFYGPMDRRAAKSMVDREVEVSQAICEIDEMEREERTKFRRIKRFVTKRIALESDKLASSTDRIEERVAQLESSRKLEISSTKDQEILLKEISAKGEQIQSQGALISSLRERISVLESLHSSTVHGQGEGPSKLDRRMRQNEKVRLSVERKRAKRRRYRANRAKAKLQETSKNLPAEEIPNQ